MDFPDDLLYAESHEWARVDGDEAVIGISAFAQDQLGDITYVDLPAEGAELEAGQEMGTVESVKAASELYSPVSGTVIAVNDMLVDRPELVNADPYGEGWLVQVRLKRPAENLMDAESYAHHAENSAH